MTEVLAGYEKLSEGKREKKEDKLPITQNRALQLLYDLRYLNIVLTTKNEDIKSSRNKHDAKHLPIHEERSFNIVNEIIFLCFRIEKQIDLESYIDPFDLDVFIPHLNSNLNHLVQRTS
ncbi:putative Oligomeric golgi complex 1 component protein, partial [Naja naja]